MSATVKGLLLSLLSILDAIAWVASPWGWMTISWMTVNYTMVGSGVYHSTVAIAFSGLFALLTTVLLFGPNLDQT